MIPIPLWFRPWMLKAGGLIIVSSLIFYSGCRTQKSIDVKKITRLKSEITTIESNYDQCLEMVVRSEENYKTLADNVRIANEEVQRLNAEYQAKVIALRRTTQIAIDNINRTHTESMSELVEENTRLQERFKLMTVAEACHDSWAEVVK